MRPIDQLDETNWSTRRDQLIYQKRSINKPDKTNWTPFWFKYPFKLHTNRQRWRMNSKCCNSKVLILYFFTWWNVTRLYIYVRVDIQSSQIGMTDCGIQIPLHIKALFIIYCHSIIYLTFFRHGCVFFFLLVSNFLNCSDIQRF